ncbi:MULTISPECIES: fatty acid desaturase family protein [unclassified Rhodococcus (in: high G+C Gram-positive bacteria)]|jgi:linoleoyl-CoA desaturase|uniref:fatty acid desaturase family protein n=1 Tax=unclassified Rhodococcus (in: high G+C Gram-positive bacteria) TaxID=192944 RepID=UPI0004815036|nr:MULTISPECIES: fatty acid desaturase [unclassified Rhodococcus (in: high G+C Gram-positive bacteria)]MBY6678135.1 fatty acid desaturase [Rhodococcus sp. BP-332]MBY6708163.1 fatty acid desaturase [Rhodococcus sp. BP-241]MDQ1180713.1 fatty acid desaturase [Rhodococcus sp. SORGH_AS_0301]MDQ1202048.1 fatty acid desaturase [Rhodococcus sp. SORGH_AS_0303]
MAISDVKEYAHLTEADVEALGHELDALRREIEESRGEKDARYIRNTIRFQRSLEALGRTTMLASNHRAAWWAGSAMLGVSKIVENMELGHNVMHGQWDWMNDPEIHSTSWEWDNTGPSEHWKQTHNYIHHKYTNVLGMDDDVGYGLIRVTRDRKWVPFNAGNLVYNTLLMLLFEYGVAVQHLELGKAVKGRVPKEETRRKLKEVGDKVGRQMLKDYAITPAITSLSPAASYRKTLTANIMANVIRNIWTNAVIFCGHFPDGAEKFTRHDLQDETQGQWYLRQMLGSANFHAGPTLAFMSGNLCYQIEHHVFPDLPSNRLAAISVRVRELCEKYDLPYTTGPFLAQYGKSWRTIAKLSLPDKYLKATADDAPETASERKFGGNVTSTVDPVTGRRSGLLSAIKQGKGGTGLRKLLSR